ncbi:MAG: hypothetical protein M1837_001798 [Sclerophora amabilis]|nr:MAG: hypothetical protein M1837_001798 [Sclerophora amabilis]
MGAKGDSGLQGWSPIIGIITAIVGNILISFALNIQRYAHIRLSREKRQRTVSLETNRRTNPKTTKYGTRRDWDSENAHGGHQIPSSGQDPPVLEDRSNDYGSPDANETDPLMQSRHSADSKSKLRSSSSTEKQTTDEQQQTYLRSPYWWVGISLMIIGEAGNFLAYGFAPASIVSPLGVVALVSNCIIAPFMLKERFRQRDFWGVVIAIAGAVTVVLSAKNSETKLGPHEIWDLITRWQFETYLGITIALMLFGMWGSRKYGDRTILIDLGLVGLFGGYTALSTKGVSSLLSYTLWRALTFPITYLLIFVLVLTALLQIKYVNRALQRFDSTQVIPIQFVIFTISVIVGSAILYQDFKSATAGQLGKFLAGCVLTFAGVYMITSGRDHDDEDDEAHEAGSDEEETIGLRGGSRNSTTSDRYQDRGNSSRDHSRSSDLSNARGRQGSRDYLDGRPQSPDSLKGLLSKSSGTPTSHPSRGRSSTNSERSVGETTTPSILDNPWRSVDEDRPKPFANPRPGVQGASTSPVVPTSKDQGLEERPSTPRISSLGTPTTPLNAERPKNLSKRSMSRLIPGPFSSPLSSSLSAVVADSLRRRGESPKYRRVGSSPRTTVDRRAVRNPPNSKSPRKGGSSAAASEENMLGASPLRDAQTPPAEGDEAPDVSSRDDGGNERSRSLRSSLGEIFRGKRRKTGSEIDENE